MSRCLSCGLMSFPGGRNERENVHVIMDGGCECLNGWGEDGYATSERVSLDTLSNGSYFVDEKSAASPVVSAHHLTATKCLKQYKLIYIYVRFFIIYKLTHTSQTRCQHFSVSFSLEREKYKTQQHSPPMVMSPHLG